MEKKKEARETIEKGGETVRTEKEDEEEREKKEVIKNTIKEQVKKTNKAGKIVEEKRFR